MKTLGSIRRRRVSSRLFVAIVAGLLAASSADAGPVVYEASGADAAAIQAAVDAFRSALGDPNNGNTAGSQPAGRREINWDGGGAGANILVVPTPMTNFANRGATFVTPGSGFEQSGQPTPEFDDLNPTYSGLFAPFSSPRLFTALNSNVMDVLFHVPGMTAAAAAGVTGFGAVFTDVDTENSTKLEFYAPDGTLLYEKFVLTYPGNDSLSFLGVTFDAGELVGRVRIISGNAAPGPDEAGALDLVVMDDFIYGEPVATGGLTITPTSGSTFRTAGIDLTVGIHDLPAALIGGQVLLNGGDVTQPFLACIQPGTIVAGGVTFRCSLPGGLLPAGTQVLQVTLDLADGTRRRNAVRWTIVANTEP